MSFCFVVTDLLSFLKLMQNALEGGMGRQEDVVIKVKADVLQSRFVTLYSPQKKNERKKNRYGGSTNAASELVPANPARAKLDCAFVFRVRDTEPLQETLRIPPSEICPLPEPADWSQITSAGW